MCYLMGFIDLVPLTIQWNLELKLTLTGRHISNSDASDLRVTEAQQERPVGPVLEDQVQVLLPNEAEYESGGAKH